MTEHRQQHPTENEALAYRAAMLRGAISGAVRALIAWFLEH